MTEISMGRAEAVKPQLPPPTEFPEVPKSLYLMVDLTPNICHCGTVMGDDGQPVLVAVYRRVNAPPAILYQAPALSYLTDELSGHPVIRRANLRWRLPESETELRLLMSGLIKS